MIRQSQYSDLFNLFDAFSQSMFPVRVTRSEPSSMGSASRTGMPIDCYATEDEAVVLASVPGIHPDDITVSVNEDILTISGSVMSNRVQEDKNGKPVTWYTSEIPRGTYERRIRLPFPIDEGKVEAQFAHGMLRIVMPKHEESKPRRITVQVLENKFPEIAEKTSEDESFSAD